MTDQADFSTYT